MGIIPISSISYVQARPLPPAPSAPDRKELYRCNFDRGSTRWDSVREQSYKTQNQEE
jgi:hypothetical protein